MRKNDKIKCYALHIPQEFFEEVLGNKKVLDIIDRYDGAALGMSKEPNLYVATLLFPSEKIRNRAAVEFTKIGINVVIEIAPGYVQRKYAKESWL